MQETRRFCYVQICSGGNEEPGPICEQRLRAAAYCQVSTEHKEQQNSLRNQIEFYKDFIQQNPYWRFVAVYYDTGSGLRANHRPEYRQMPDD